MDASAEHVGAALQQRATPAAPWEPLGFFSRKLDPAQVRYSAYDRELLACMQGVRHFPFMLEGRRFTLYTDHKPLNFALSKAAEPWTPHQCRHLSYVAKFTSDIRHVAGQDNMVADTLSHLQQICAVCIQYCMSKCLNRIYENKRLFIYLFIYLSFGSVGEIQKFKEEMAVTCSAEISPLFS